MYSHIAFSCALARPSVEPTTDTVVRPYANMSPPGIHNRVQTLREPNLCKEQGARSKEQGLTCAMREACRRRRSKETPERYHAKQVHQLLQPQQSKEDATQQLAPHAGEAPPAQNRPDSAKIEPK